MLPYLMPYRVRWIAMVVVAMRAGLLGVVVKRVIAHVLSLANGV